MGRAVRKCFSFMILFFCLCRVSPAVASDEAIQIYGFTPEEIQRFILAVINVSARLDILQQNDLRLVLAEPEDLTTARIYMPMIKVRTKDPKEPERYEREPLEYAEVQTCFQFLPSRDGGVRVTVAADLVANPGRRREKVIRENYRNYFGLCRYLQAYFTGGCGAGIYTRQASGAEMYVDDVLDGSSAAAAGIQPGDRIRIINKTPAVDVALESFERKYQWSQYGKPFTLEMERPSGQRYTAQVENAYIPAQVERLKRFYPGAQVWEGYSMEEVLAASPHYTPKPSAQAEVKKLSSGLEFDASGKVTSVSKGSPAEKAGVRPGDMIKEINLTPFAEKGAAQAREIIAGRLEKGFTVLLTLTRGQQELFLKMKGTAN